ncbi:MAG: class II aldolase/adducin family protein [Victivallaceae bacterium]|nr:class II aldolase/adducin family protein [Victivallaceae bacterium]
MHELQRKYRDEIQELADVAAKLGRLGYVASHGGNLSAKLGDGSILITPTKVPKEDMVFDDIVIVDANGNTLFAADGRKPTGETPMHTHIYHLRPDLKSLIHAHPPILTGFSLTDSNILTRPILPEPVLELGPILAIPYAEVVSMDLAKKFESVVSFSNAWLMKNHGITIGSADTPKRTLGLLQMAEDMADSIRTGMMMREKINEIPREEVAKLENVMIKRGLPFPGNPKIVKSLTSLYFGD